MHPEVQKEKKRQRALKLSYFYLARRPRTAREVREYLEAKDEKYQFGTVLIDEVIQELLQVGYLNDHQYVIWYLDQKNRTALKSLSVMRRELRQRGVSDHQVEDVLAQHAVPSQQETAMQALAKRWPQYRKLDQKTRFRRAAAYLGRKGYGYDIIRKAIADRESDQLQ
jgi:regulatory protein